MAESRFSIVCVVVLTLMLASCGDDAQIDAAQTPDDAGHDAGDATRADAMADSGGDAGEPPCEAFPARQIAGTAITNALADDPAQCGQDNYRWLDDDALATITAIGSAREFDARFIESILNAEGIVSPREVAHDTRVVQFGYMTQDRGQMVEASAMVAFPTDRQPGDAPREVLLLLHGTTGFADACAPSNDLASKGLAALLASYGYFVVAPDYVGLKGLGEATGFLHPYLVGQTTAIASLDAVRAAANLPSQERGGWCLQPEVVALGGSQGGHAALWVDRLAPYYAREMELAGVVATVPPADMLGQMDRAIETLVSATGNTVAFLGTTASWYGVEDRLDEVFVEPYDVEIPEGLGSTCDFGDITPDLASTADIFSPELIDAAENDTLASLAPWGCITTENGLTTTSVARIEPENDVYGILFVLGEDDELVHTPIERQAFDSLCDQGMQMQFLECAGAGHGETTFFAFPEILDFVDARMAGQRFDAASACARTEPVTCRGTQ